jgi:pantoate--beta-alanine ligase
MYSPEFQTHVEPGDLADRLEGPRRPGHFRGVATVVTKLFGATTPDIACFGQKDFQQLAIITRMAADLDLGVEIIGVPIVREPDGLARSSRNVRLTPDDRAAATVLSRALDAGRRVYDNGGRDAATIVRITSDLIADEPRASLEYVELVDASTLRDVVRIDGRVALLTAAWFGDVRLIDNHVFGG